MKNISINNFSKISGIESSKLRYWDEVGVFSPKGRDPYTNYRYYSVFQLLTLNVITTLSTMKIPIKKIAELVEDRSPYSMLNILENQERIYDIELNYILQRYSISRARRELINQGIKANEESIYIANKDEKSIIIWSKNEGNKNDSFIEPLVAKVASASDYHINLNYPIGGIYENLETFSKSPKHPCYFYSLNPNGHHKINRGKYLTGYSKGYYGDVGDLPERLKYYADNNSIKLTGPVYIEYLFDEFCTDDPNEYLAQCCIAIANGKQ